MQLVISVFSCSPHLETSAEIALSLHKDKIPVKFIFIDEQNPDDYGYPKISLGWLRNRRNKIIALKKKLHSQGLDFEIFNSKSTEDKLFIKNNLVLEICNFKNLDDLSKFQYHNAFLGWGVASSLVFKTKNSNPDIEKYKTLITDYFISAISVFMQTLEIIEKYQPSRIITYNGRFALSKAIAEAARIKNVPISYHEVGSTIDKYAIFDYPLHHLRSRRREIKEYWKKSTYSFDEKQKIASDFFNRRRKGDGINWTSFTKDQMQGYFRSKNFNRRIVYFSSSDDEYIFVKDAIEHPIFKSQREAILWLIEQVKNNKEYELVIRIHPHLASKSDTDRYWWENLSTSENIFIEKPNSIVDSYALAESADVVVTYGSTIGVESAFLGKPVVLLGDALYRELDCVYEPQDSNEALKLIFADCLEAKPKENTYPYGFYFLTHGISHQYYKPISIFEGYFMNSYLSYYPFSEKINYYLINKLIFRPMKSVLNSFNKQPR
ncbi:hypothetical protein RYO59_000634 [Thermosynechococcaceae cyanobacterium Okahandja]